MARNPSPARLALPVLPALVPLRTVYFHNPRFERLEAAWMASVLAQAVEFAKSTLGLALEFAPPREIPIAEGFLGYGPRQQARVEPTLYDFKNGRGDRRRLVEGTRRGLEHSGSSLDQLLRYARPHLLRAPDDESFHGLAEAAVDTQLVRLEAWRGLRGADGQPLLDASPYNEFNAWLAAAWTASWPFEVILTNQLIASAEYDNNHLHGALRGGVSNGLCTPTPQARHGLVSVLSAFPFTSNDAASVELRGGAPAQGGAPARWAAALLVHELGHQLLHLNHPFARADCVMNPPPLLLFPQWVAALDGRSCPLGSSPEMTPGAVKFPQARGEPGVGTQSM